jgi:hypothetical protein
MLRKKKRQRENEKEREGLRDVGTKVLASNLSWTVGARKTGDFSLLHSVQTGTGAQPAPYPMGIESSFPENKPAKA